MIGETDIHKLEKNNLSALSNNTSMMLNLSRDPIFFVLERKRVYKEMRGDKKIRPYCSAALVRSQVEFVKKKPPNVKDLIRLVKYWRKTCIPQIGNEHLPPSYLLELLTIHAWEEAKCPTTFDMKIGFKAVMKLLKVHYKLRVYWGDYYGKDVITCRYYTFLGWLELVCLLGLKELLATVSRTQAISNVCCLEGLDVLTVMNSI